MFRGANNYSILFFMRMSSSTIITCFKKTLYYYLNNKKKHMHAKIIGTPGYLIVKLSFIQIFWHLNRFHFKGMTRIDAGLFHTELLTTHSGISSVLQFQVRDITKR